MNIPEGATPFNLQAALNGAKTICRDGSPGPVEFHVLPEWADDEYHFVGRMPQGSAYWYTKDGKYFSDTDDAGDLFMAPVEKEITAWAVVDKNGQIHGTYLSLEFTAPAIAGLADGRPTRAPFSLVELTGKWKG